MNAYHICVAYLFLNDNVQQTKNIWFSKLLVIVMIVQVALQVLTSV